MWEAFWVKGQILPAHTLWRLQHCVNSVIWNPHQVNNMDKHKYFSVYVHVNIRVQGCGVWAILFIPRNIFKFLRKWRRYILGWITHYFNETQYSVFLCKICWQRVFMNNGILFRHSTQFKWSLRHISRTWFQWESCHIVQQLSKCFFIQGMIEAHVWKCDQDFFICVKKWWDIWDTYSCGKVNLCLGHLSFRKFHKKSVKYSEERSKYEGRER